MSNRNPSAGVSWGGSARVTRTWPTIVFPAVARLPEYAGKLLAICLDKQVGRALTVTLAKESSANAELCVITPTSTSDDTRQTQLERNAMEQADTTCLIIENVRHLTLDNCLRTRNRAKVSIVIFLGERSDVSVKALGIHFPHLCEADIVYAQSIDVSLIAERIISYASTR